MPRKKWYMYFIIVLITGIGISVFSLFYMRFLEIKQIKEEVYHHSELLYRRFIQEISLNMEALYSINSLFYASDVVTREDFHLYSQGPLSRHDTIQALEWIPAVAHNERQAVEEELLKVFSVPFITERAADGSMVEAGIRDEYFPVLYMEPYKNNEAAAGFDLGSDSSRKETLLKAGMSGMPQATAGINLVQETEKQKGVLIVLPVKHKENSSDIAGFTLIVLRLGEIMERVVENREEGVELALIDLSDNGAVLFGHSEKEFVIFEKEIIVGGRSWAFQCGADILSIRSQISSLPYVTSLFLIMLTLLICSLIYLLYRKDLQNSVVENMVRLRTEQFKREKERAEESDRLKTEFLRTISHELKTPMTVILGNIGFISDKSRFLSLLGPERIGVQLCLSNSEGLKEILDIGSDIEGAAGNMMKLINDLLDISLFQAGKVMLCVENFSVQELIDDVFHIFSPRFQAKKLKFYVTGESQDVVLADKKRIKQVLVNLLENALKFTYEGEVELIISNTSEKVIFKVRDTGCGIGDDMKVHIFDPFYQGDGSETRSAQGLGLGLAISQKILEYHGCELNVSSEGEGALFTFSINREV